MEWRRVAAFSGSRRASVRRRKLFHIRRVEIGPGWGGATGQASTCERMNPAA